MNKMFVCLSVLAVALSAGGGGGGGGVGAGEVGAEVWSGMRE